MSPHSDVITSCVLVLRSQTVFSLHFYMTSLVDGEEGSAGSPKVRIDPVSKIISPYEWPTFAVAKIKEWIYHRSMAAAIKASVNTFWSEHCHLEKLPDPLLASCTVRKWRQDEGLATWDYVRLFYNEDGHHYHWPFCDCHFHLNIHSKIDWYCKLTPSLVLA